MSFHRLPKEHRLVIQHHASLLAKTHRFKECQWWLSVACGICAQAVFVVLVTPESSWRKIAIWTGVFAVLLGLCIWTHRAAKMSKVEQVAIWQLEKELQLAFSLDGKKVHLVDGDELSPGLDPFEHEAYE